MQDTLSGRRRSFQAREADYGIQCFTTRFIKSLFVSLNARVASWMNGQAIIHNNANNLRWVIHMTPPNMWNATIAMMRKIEADPEA
jgi:hypothetical protein